jgi:hypothetical protein
MGPREIGAWHVDGVKVNDSVRPLGSASIVVKMNDSARPLSSAANKVAATAAQVTK